METSGDDLADSSDVDLASETDDESFIGRYRQRSHNLSPDPIAVGRQKNSAGRCREYAATSGKVQYHEQAFRLSAPFVGQQRLGDCKRNITASPQCRLAPPQVDQRALFQPPRRHWHPRPATTR